MRSRLWPGPVQCTSNSFQTCVACCSTQSYKSNLHNNVLLCDCSGIEALSVIQVLSLESRVAEHQQQQAGFEAQLQQSKLEAQRAQRALHTAQQDAAASAGPMGGVLRGMSGSGLATPGMLDTDSWAEPASVEVGCLLSPIGPHAPYTSISYILWGPEHGLRVRTRGRPALAPTLGLCPRVDTSLFFKRARATSGLPGRRLTVPAGDHVSRM